MKQHLLISIGRSPYLFWTVLVIDRDYNNHFFHYLITEGRGNVRTPGAVGCISAEDSRQTNFRSQIAVIAYEHGVHEIWTHDRDFAYIPSVKVFDPLQSR